MTGDLDKALEKYFGFQAFRSGQREVVERLIERKDTLAVMPTGLGKSLCYQLAAQLLSGMTLVISPLIALMQDQVDSLRRRKMGRRHVPQQRCRWCDDRGEIRRYRARPLQAHICRSRTLRLAEVSGSDQEVTG